MGASEDSTSVDIVRMGQMATVHEGVRELHIDARVAAYAHRDEKTAQTAGMPHLRFQRHTLITAPSAKACKLYSMHYHYLFLPILCDLCNIYIQWAKESTHLPSYAPCHRYKHGIVSVLIPVDHKTSTDARWKELMDELAALSAKLSKLPPKGPAIDPALVVAAGEVPSKAADDAAERGKLEARKRTINVRLDSCRIEVRELTMRIGFHHVRDET